MSEDKSPMLAQALDFIAEDISVIPCRPGTKEPSIPWKEFQSRVADEEMVRDWFDGTDNNLAVVCGSVSGGLVVLDFDDAETFEALWEKINFVKGAPIVRTARGYHVYLRVKDGQIESRHLPGLDIQSDGHYVIAPPSIHPSGARYELVEGDLNKIPMVPEDFIIGLFKELEKVVSSQPSGNIAEGSRNNTLFSLGLRLLKEGESPELILEHLREANAKNCHPPLEDTEIVQIGESVERYRAAIRRGSELEEAAGEPAILRRGRLRLDPARREAAFDDRRIDLSATEFSLLEFFMRSPGWVFSRAQIIAAVRGPDYPVTDRSVDVQILSLRRKLGEGGKYIETVRGVGYRLGE